ncbi:helix-turn-helix domain-containing protein [Pedobacter sp. Hv1]|uniref:helix-turn-helix domain-containing protein n=1 Tax=Pedobacter sp. Hv1 TaxID=1740090 RepID=UPI0006D89C7F|nr:helix-turn-helix domain-containing protein [Pedobacter sp. Hv1]KQB99476.1 hypothetical protein AQF98_18095 [Pedobacter sp. Hv1]
MVEKIDKTLILNRIKSHYKFKSDVQLAKFFGIAGTTLSNWYVRDTMNYDLVFTKCGELNPNWIVFGEGKPTKGYPNLEDTPFSITEEVLEKIKSAKDMEIARLQELLASHEATIAAQAIAMEAMKKLLDLQGKG